LRESENPDEAWVQRVIRSARSLIGQEHAFIDKSLPESNAVVEVDSQNSDGNPADWGESDQSGTVPPEMPAPPVPPRVKQRDKHFRYIVSAGDARPFMAIAGEACQTQVGRPGWTAVFLGDDMVNLKREPIVFLGDLAVFASIDSSFPD
jgi:hypothetical protein